MTDRFVSQLRARKSTIQLAPEGASNAITIRVEMPEVWDVVRIVALPTEQMSTVKARALEALFPDGEYQGDFVLKLNGWEILDESATLADADVRDGSTLLLTHRKKRPVR